MQIGKAKQGDTTATITLWWIHSTAGRGKAIKGIREIWSTNQPRRKSAFLISRKRRKGLLGAAGVYSRGIIKQRVKMMRFLWKSRKTLLGQKLANKRGTWCSG